MSVSRSLNRERMTTVSGPRALLTYGRTLARRTSHDAAYGVICNAIGANKVRGQVCIAVLRTEQPGRFDVEASFGDLTADQALDALQIASARIGVLHRVPASTAVPIAADEADMLRQLAERIVDRHRSFGWWEKIVGVMRWFESDAGFRYPREKMVEELMRDIAAWRHRDAAREAA